MTQSTSTAPDAAQRFLRAVAWMLGAVVSFSLVAVSGREVTSVLSVSEAIFWRNCVALVVLLVAVRMMTGSLTSLISRQPLRQVGRNVIHFCAQYAWLTALTLIPLAEVVALEFTTPLWVAVLAPLLLGERLTAVRLVAAIVGFAGALVVIDPGGAALSPGTVFALMSAVGFAFSVILVKQLMRTDAAAAVLFYMVFLQLAPSFLMSWPAPRLPEGATLIWVAVLGVSGLLAHLSLAKAYVLADAIVVAPLDFLRLPLMAVVGVLLYAEPFDPLVLAGGALIIVANLTNLWGERRKARS